MIRVKKAFAILFVAIFFLVLSVQTNAIVFETEIGNFLGGEPPPPPPEPIPGDSNEEIVYWAEIISARLSKGRWNFYNKIEANPPITNRGYTVKKAFYWCTRIIFDSYNLAGIQFAKKTGVVEMYKYWNKPEQRARGFRTIDYQNNTPARTTILSLKRGDAVMKLKAEEVIYSHVVMIDEIEITDPVNGHGRARIIQSNGNRIFYPVSIRGWRFDDPGWSSTRYRKMSFGLYRK